MKLQAVENYAGYLMFQCPGCDCSHGVTTEQSTSIGPKWGWNGSMDRPTFTPSILVRIPANPDAIEEFKEYRVERICHSFVTDGRIQFLGDCTHWYEYQPIQTLTNSQAKRSICQSGEPSGTE